MKLDVRIKGGHYWGRVMAASALFTISQPCKWSWNHLLVHFLDHLNHSCTISFMLPQSRIIGVCVSDWWSASPGEWPRRGVHPALRSHPHPKQQVLRQVSRGRGEGTEDRSPPASQRCDPSKWRKVDVSPKCPSAFLLSNHFLFFFFFFPIAESRGFSCLAFPPLDQGMALRGCTIFCLRLLRHPSPFPSEFFFFPCSFFCLVAALEPDPFLPFFLPSSS